MNYLSKMSNGELVKGLRIAGDSVHYSGDDCTESLARVRYFEHEIELLRRLTRLEQADKEVELLKAENDRLTGLLLCTDKIRKEREGK
jgi:hypothetical protein